MFALPGYSITRKIGEGGTAQVYLATQLAFRRQVAIKVLLPAVAADADCARRFLAEAEIVAGLGHPNIVPVYDFGQQDSTFYMVMEYLPGGTLAQWINRGMETGEVLQVLSEMASALYFAHGKGFVHRDVKPENILFRENNSAVLTDFGIARQKNASNSLTVAGAVMGTPKYMSPEQLRGLELDGRSDLYALGVMFYEMMAGKPPYEDRDFMALAMKHLQAPIPSLPPLKSRYQRFLEKLMAKAPENRFQTGLEIVKLIQQVNSGMDISRMERRGCVYRLPTELTDEQQKQQRRATVKEGLQCGEVVTQKGFFSDRYKFTGYLVALDWSRLSTSLSTMGNTQLSDWFARRGRNGAAVEIFVTTEEENFGKARTAVKLWGKGQDGKFLKKTGVTLHLKDYDNGRKQSARLSW